ncbi:MAG: MBL fold metallo-hydrolase [Acidobacteriota bacterium]|nr:MBL fold metallo-hydrolase [Acidobacteriota bacterium]
MASSLAPAVLAAQKGSEPLLDRPFARVTRLADGVYVTIAAPGGPQCISNGAVIAGRDSTLIVEGHFFPEGAELEIEVARMVSKAPVRAAVNTHYHLDHTFGNIAYERQRIPILAHERAPALMKERYAALQQVDKGPLLAPLERRAAAAEDPVEKRHLNSDLGALKWMYAAIDRVTLAYPTELLGASDLPKKLDLGGISVLIEHEVGHTPTDLIVRLPEQDIVFTGDLLFEKSYPVAFDCDMISWRRALDRLAGYGPRTRFVPGHGPVCGVEVVHEFADLIADLHGHSEKMFVAGASVEEATQRYAVPARFGKFDIFSWDWAIGGAMRNYYAQRKA